MQTFHLKNDLLIAKGMLQTFNNLSSALKKLTNRWEIEENRSYYSLCDLNSEIDECCESIESFILCVNADYEKQLKKGDKK